MDFLKRRSNQTFLYLIPVEPPPLPTFSSQSARKFSNNPSKCALLQPCITADSAYPEKERQEGRDLQNLLFFAQNAAAAAATIALHPSPCRR